MKGNILKILICLIYFNKILCHPAVIDNNNNNNKYNKYRNYIDENKDVDSFNEEEIEFIDTIENIVETEVVPVPRVYQYILIKLREKINQVLGKEEEIHIFPIEEIEDLINYDYSINENDDPRVIYEEWVKKHKDSIEREYPNGKLIEEELKEMEEFEKKLEEDARKNWYISGIEVKLATQDTWEKLLNNLILMYPSLEKFKNWISETDPVIWTFELGETNIFEDLF